MANLTTPFTLLDVDLSVMTSLITMATRAMNITNTSDTDRNSSDHRVIPADGTELDAVDEVLLPPEYIYVIMFKYVSPVIIFSGVICNILSLVVLQSRYYRRAPSTFILSALALSDTGVLLCGPMRHWIRMITDFELDIRSLTQGTCWFHFFFTYYLPQLSSWSLSLLTVERMASVRWPFKAKELFNKARMITLWSLTALCLAAINAHCFKTMTLIQHEYQDGNDTVQYYICSEADDSMAFMKYAWPWIDLVLISILPLIIILICNAVIIVLLLKSRRLRQGQMKVTADDDSSSITAMLIGISILFFFFTTPVSIYFIGVRYWPQSTHSQVFSSLTAYATVNMLYYLSNSTNFLAYCISGSKFRRALVAVLCCREIEKPVTTTGSKYATSMSTVNCTKTEDLSDTTSAA